METEEFETAGCPLIIMVYEEYLHKNGRRYRQNSPLARSFSSMDDVHHFIDTLKALADPGDLDRRWGAVPASYDYSIYKITKNGRGRYAIQVGTTANHVKEDV